MLLRQPTADDIVKSLRLPSATPDLVDADRPVAAAAAAANKARDAYQSESERRRMVEGTRTARPQCELDEAKQAEADANITMTQTAAALRRAVAAREPALREYEADVRQRLAPVISEAAAVLKARLAEVDAILGALEALDAAAKSREIRLNNPAAGAAGGTRKLLRGYVTPLVEAWK